MKTLIKLNLFVLIIFFSLSAQAEIIQVPSSHGDTPTAYWSYPNSKAVLMFLPGGAGNFNIASKNPQKPFWLNSLVFEKGIDVVFVDSNVSLGWHGGNIAPRYTTEHLERVKSVIQFYKNKLNKPIFLMGHSNSTISIAEYMNQSKENQSLISGAIFSAGRNETTLNSPINLPILFIHHENDPNIRWTSYEHTKKLYEEVKKINKSSTKLATVHGGEDSNAISTEGYHMYQGSLEEASKYLIDFIEGKK
jgi:hypothetical protein